jgi:endogenous inhibitor of DNA gyrase (YacG/DUF329 family)
MLEHSCKRDKLVCAQCGREFEVYRSRRNAGRKFCSKECYLDSLRVAKEKKICRGCNQSKPISDFNTYKKNGKVYLGSKCRACSAIYHREHERDRVHRAGVKPARDNPECSGYIADLAEQICAHYFEGVKRMPNCHPGYDLICKKGFKIDVKSSCRIKVKSHPNASDQWMFTLKRSKAADYFLCLAFRDRKTREPEHIWLIPSNEVNHLFILGIAESRVNKWIKFEKPIDKAIACCAALSS